jgi:hypothetical protein
MPVVISEFEVIAEPAPERAPPRQTPERKGPQESKPLRVADILEIQAWHQRRMERLFAD